MNLHVDFLPLLSNEKSVRLGVRSSSREKRMSLESPEDAQVQHPDAQCDGGGLQEGMYMIRSTFSHHRAKDITMIISYFLCK